MRIAATLMLALSAAPALAQSWGSGPPPFSPGPFNTSIGREVESIRRSVDRGRRDGQLSRRDARAVRRDAGQIDTLSDRYASDGHLSDSERAELNARAEVLRAEVNRERMLRPVPTPN